MEKKTWIKPELNVLVRSKPEESILTACKTGSVGAAYNNTAGACNHYFNNWPYCARCDAIASS